MASEVTKLNEDCQKSNGTKTMEEIEDPLDLDVITQGLSECLSEDSLLLDGYIRAYTEITKFLDSLGSVFGFVSSDVHAKLNVLRCFRKGGAGDCYYSIQSMLEYEKDQNDPDNLKGARTLLRLHRALEFIKGFLEVVVKADMEANLGPLVQPVYANTLAKHHNWLVTTSVNAVLLFLPNKKNFIVKLLGQSEEKQQELYRKSDEMCRLIEKVYSATQAFYSDYKMLNLP